MAKEARPGNRNWTQLNDGDTQGLLRGTYNCDLDANRGKVRATNPILSVFNTDDDSDFEDYAAAFAKYNNDYYSVSDYVFRTTSGNPTDNSDWSKDSRSNTPSPANLNTDAVVWNDYFLVIENNTSPSSGDIARLSGSTWDRNWWRTTLSANTDSLIKLVAAPDGNLYPVSSSGKVYKLTPALAVSTSGQGTLDLSERPLEFTTAVTNSTRMWIGFANEENGTGGVVEWDMAATSISPNRTHQLGAPVRCLAVWNDIVIAILEDGNIKYNAGSGFTEWEGVSLPKTDYPLDERFIHKNGWAIIDDLPHFLINFALNANQGSTIGNSTRNGINAPSGIYCLDPEVGFYHRFALGSGESTQDDYGHPSLYNVGALYALRDSEQTQSKLLCSHTIIDETNTEHAMLSYDDFANTNDVKSYIQYTKQTTNKVMKNIEVLHKKLSSGSHMRVYTRLSEDDSVFVSGNWVNNTQFNTTDDISGVANNNLAQVKYGKGAGQLLRVNQVTQGNNVNLITFQDENTYADLNNQSVLEVTNYRYSGAITSTALDHHTFALPFSGRNRQVDVLIEITQAAGNTEELDYTINES